MESVGNDANSVFHEHQKFFKSIPFKIFRKCSESVNFDANIDLQEDLKFFKSDAFENDKSFVPVEVQSHSIPFVLLQEKKIRELKIHEVLT